MLTPSYTHKYKVRSLTFNPFRGGGIVIESHLFIDKMPSLNRYPLKVIMTNISPVITELKNDVDVVTYEGLLFDTHRNVVNDIRPTDLSKNSNWAIPDSFYKYYFRIFGDALYPYFIDLLVLKVPKSSQIPTWMKAILPLTVHTWTAYFLFVWTIIVISESVSKLCPVNLPQFQALEIFRVFILGGSYYTSCLLL
ncbi:hypothetical protein PR048_001397 [Dryococelus australis]|uniref:Uncharacterized protein n=1 Tax=Dryococelus australis TaxID=614101 RepID=A0ABQ9IHD0_9NEOP|nr:hypothetical protein PR048_001397 [Dryococelus australis]